MLLLDFKVAAMFMSWSGFASHGLAASPFLGIDSETARTPAKFSFVSTLTNTFD